MADDQSSEAAATHVHSTSRHTDRVGDRVRQLPSAAHGMGSQQRQRVVEMPGETLGVAASLASLIFPNSNRPEFASRVSSSFRGRSIAQCFSVCDVTSPPRSTRASTSKHHMPSLASFVSSLPSRFKSNPNQINSNQFKSSQFKSNQVESNHINSI